MPDSPLIAVLGLGAWGKTLFSLVAQHGYPLVGWRRSQGGLADVPIAQSKVIFSALPITSVRSVAEQVAALLPAASGVILVSATKGLEPATAKTAAQVWQSVLPALEIVVLSGPNLSVEIDQGLPAATVIAGKPEVTEQLQSILATPAFRVYTNSDLRGVEIGGVVKNVMAIACGVNDGLALGVNARSALLTRGLVEMVRIGSHWGGQVATFYGLSGLGDLLATCTSPLSRNYQVGWQLAQGKPLEQVLAELVGTAEGVNTATVLADYALQVGLDLPITQEVAAVVGGQRTPTQAISNLLDRPFKSELADF
jgi:glycerol-3-phosphate dehydrogenase (NAD(P)+)